MSLDSIREKLGYQPLLLGVVALAASAALAFANTATKDHIAAAEARDMQMSLAQVLPEGFADNDLLADVIEMDGPKGKLKVHVAKKDGKTVGAVFQMAERGYAADIVCLMAVDAKGSLLGVRVLKHSETPGLGDKIEIGKNPWIESFKGKSLQEPVPARWGVKKDGGVFDQFAGATITPRAVVKAVKGGLEFFESHKQQILG
ncbi:MAG: electron transport complex subunit RsxG [Rhodocyclaceae bacterium]|nr:electron transport complex subunit RsxG [Rhodocyclaceae bacterium]